MRELNRIYSIAIHEKLTQSPTVLNSDDEDLYTVPPDDDESEINISKELIERFNRNLYMQNC